MPKEGLILIDKPKGISSFDCIRRLRAKYRDSGEGIPKMGHAGTLDPMASGLLIIGLGKDTKKLSDLLKLSKVYDATITLGISTDSFDMDGSVIAKSEVGNINRTDIASRINDFIGEVELEVPVFSALKRDGKPLYEYAREGKSVEKVYRKMRIYRAELIDFDGINIKARFEVGSGTYIRSIANDFGKRFNLPSTLSELRRTSIGEYLVDNSTKI
jgi:tRNA pseudouridine55 synthase